MTRIKPWYLSVLVWVGIVEIAIGSCELYVSTDWDNPHAWVLFGMGVLILVRRWLTDEPISSVHPNFDVLRPRVKANPAKPRPGKPNHRLET